MSNEFRELALEYHRRGRPGKLAITATKPLRNQNDLALAYSPGVAYACRDIDADPAQAASLTARANLVAVISNGTAVLGLGDIGALASKPVMEGKAVLFKKFAGIDVFDIEIDEKNVDMLVETIARLEPTFGGINLEDIGAPVCFEVEDRLRARMKIPVFHDDQHGTAIVVGAAVRNALSLVGKAIEDVRLVASGAGAAGIACLDLLVRMGLRRENIILLDTKGVIYQGRAEGMNEYKARYAADVAARTLCEALVGADIFLGLSAPGVLSTEMLASMNRDPLVLALANPDPEITPEIARKARPDAIVATGRSDYPNQVNNVLCFPFLFRGALDVGATVINEEMKIACVDAIAGLARIEAVDIVASAYADEDLRFGPEYILPKPFDPRLVVEVASAVAEAAMATGVATRPVTDIAAYRENLSQYVYRSAGVMAPIFRKAAQNPKRVVYAEGEDERVLRAAQTAVDDGLAIPILLGRPTVIREKLRELGLRLQIDRDLTVIDPEQNGRCSEYAEIYRSHVSPRNVSAGLAETLVREMPSLFAALMVRQSDADAMICGVNGQYRDHHDLVKDGIGTDQTVVSAAMTLLLAERGAFFICDTHVNPDPTAEELADIARLAADKVRHFGFRPRISFLSQPEGTNASSVIKTRRALALLNAKADKSRNDGEIGSAAGLLSSAQAFGQVGDAGGQANVLVMPGLDAAHITLEMLKALGGGLSVGPILLGIGAPAHIVTSSITVRGIVNMTALAVMDAQALTSRPQLLNAAE